MKKIRLLQVIPNLNSGGAERGTVDIANAIVKSDNISFVVSNGGRLERNLKLNKTNFIKLPVHSKNPWIIYRNINKIQNIVKKNNINIIHTRSRAPAWSTYYVAKKNKTKSVSTFHNIYDSSNKLKKIYNSQLGKANSIIAISNFVKSKIIELYNIPEKKIRVIHRGIDGEYFDIMKIKEDLFLEFIKNNNLFYDKKIILYPARLTSWKGQIEFLDILKKLDSNKYFCIFAGDDNNLSYTKKLIHKINSLGLSSSCKLMGHVDDMRYLYKLSHVVINASIKPEGFGRTIGESFLMNKPVIAYDHGGVSEQMKMYEKDFKIPYKDQAKMVNSINFLLDVNYESISKIVSKSNLYIKNNFSKKNMISKTIKLYQDILSK